MGVLHGDLKSYTVILTVLTFQQVLSRLKLTVSYHTYLVGVAIFMP